MREGESANPDYYLAHYDIEHDPARTAALPKGPTASRLAQFDHEAIARTKSYVDQVTLPADSELPPALIDFFESIGRPEQQARSARLEALGLNIDSDLERSLGRRITEAMDG